ncbi:B-cell receptor CD22 isoform 2-T2 [Callospermophilus lateralis]|uniref:B-cell receptor CD22 isoform X2 n=1 Tax=Callospermophilus lateralis TaxID=76772 RepID=UPI0040540995
MHLLGPYLFLLLEYLAFSNSNPWNFKHPTTLYAWEGACVWIPCTYRIPKADAQVDRLVVFHNPEYDKTTKRYVGTVLYNSTVDWKSPSQQGRVQFLGDPKNNCTLSIESLLVSDSGWLGLRMMTKDDKWMDHVNLSISKSPFPPRIQLPSELQESQTVTVTCLLNFTCFGYDIELRWALEGLPFTPASSTISSSTIEAVSTKSQIDFKPEWTHHGKNLTCQVWHSAKVLSEETVQLNVKHAPKRVTTVIESPTPIREGDSVTLRCRYNSSNPTVTRFVWSPQGLWNEPSQEVLKIQNVAWDTPPISCSACNQWCSPASPVDLDVQYAPKEVKVLQISSLSEIHAGDQVRLQCHFSKSHPEEVHFFWKKNGSLLEAKGRELNFDSVSPEDAGNYSCLVKNSIGQSASEAWRLQVLYAPRRLWVSITPGDRVMEGRKAALTCESDANPPISQYTWFDWNNQDLQYSGQTLSLDPVKVEHSGSYWCKGVNQLGEGESPPSTLTIYYSPETIGRRTTMGIGICLAILILVIWGVKLQQNWKRTRSQQGPQENSNGRSFFVRNKKVRRTLLSEGPHSLGCYNPMMEDGTNYATLRFPETDTPRTGGTGPSETQGPLPNNEDTVTYSVVQKCHVGDYENVAPSLPEDDGIHYSELVHFGTGERPRAPEDVDYVTLKH